MLYKELNVGDETYKCRLSAKTVIALEDKGINPVNALLNGDQPSTKDLMTIFHAMLQEYQHGIKFDDACRIYDEFCSEDDNDQTKFFTFLIKVLQNNGYISKEVDFDKVFTEELEKATKQLEGADEKN